MKTNIIVLFGTLALIALLSFNVKVNKSGDLKTFSLKTLLILSEAQSEGSGAGNCESFGCYHAPNCQCTSYGDQVLIAFHCYPW